MNASMKWLLAVAVGGMAAAGCSAEAVDTDEPEVGTSEDPLGTIVPSPVESQCVARPVLELAQENSSGPTLFVACEGHDGNTANPYKAQSIKVTSRDPFTGALYKAVSWDSLDPDGVVCVSGTCTSFGAPMVIERLCNKDIYYKCPCGIAEVIDRSTPLPSKSYRCKTSRFEGITIQR